MGQTARERATTSLRMRSSAFADAPVIELGHGSDNAAFVAGDLVLRVAEGRSVLREARLLRQLAPRLSIPVPAPRFVDEERGVLAYPLIPGQPLLGRRPTRRAATRLGRFLRDLHDIEPAEVCDLVPHERADPHEWLQGLDGPPDLIGRLHKAVPPPTSRGVVAHADLGAEHILELDGEITGVIDWSDAALTDPALDFARLYRDFGPTFLAEALDAYGGLADGEAAMARIEFFARCTALEDLAYGRATGRREYARAAEHSIAWLFERTGPDQRSA